MREDMRSLVYDYVSIVLGNTHAPFGQHINAIPAMERIVVAYKTAVDRGDKAWAHVTRDNIHIDELESASVALNDDIVEKDAEIARLDHVVLEQAEEIIQLTASVDLFHKCHAVASKTWRRDHPEQAEDFDPSIEETMTAMIAEYSFWENNALTELCNHNANLKKDLTAQKTEVAALREELYKAESYLEEFADDAEEPPLSDMAARAMARIMCLEIELVEAKRIATDAKRHAKEDTWALTDLQVQFHEIQAKLITIRKVILGLD